MFGFLFMFFFYDRDDQQLQWVQIRVWFILIAYSIFIVVYLITFSVLRSRLKNHFKNFYKTERKRVLTLWLCILASVTGRILMSVIYANQAIMEWIKSSFSTNSWAVPLLSFFSILIGSLTPISAMLYSLLHAIKLKQRVTEM